MVSKPATRRRRRQQQRRQSVRKGECLPWPKLVFQRCTFQAGSRGFESRLPLFERKVGRGRLKCIMLDNLTIARSHVGAKSGVDYLTTAKDTLEKQLNYFLTACKVE